MFLFLSLVCSQFWEFNEREFEAKINNSFDHPLFAACYTDYCPHCVGVPQALRDYANSLGDSTNVVFTTINCGSTDRCNLLQIRGVPGFRFIRGTNPRYWIPTTERGLPGWSDFLHDVNGPPIHKVDSPDERREPIAGSTAFYFSVYEDNTFLNEYREAAAQFRLFGCTFSYAFESVDNPTITAYLSSDCQISLNPKTPGEIRQFIDRNKFSVPHRYDLDEFERRDRTVPLALVVAEDNPLQQHLAMMQRVARDHCHDMKVGWATSDEGIAEAFGRVDEDAPFLGVINDRYKLTVSTKKKISEADQNGILEEGMGLGTGNSLVVKATLAVIGSYFLIVFWFYLLYNRS
jgi:hypothetical protein